MLLLFGGLIAAATAAGLRLGWIVIGLPNFQALAIAQAMVVGATLAYLVNKLRIHSRPIALGIAALCAVSSTLFFCFDLYIYYAGHQGFAEFMMMQDSGVWWGAFQETAEALRETGGRPAATGNAKLMAALFVLVFWLPVLGVAFSGLALYLSRNTKGWARPTAILTLISSSAITASVILLKLVG